MGRRCLALILVGWMASACAASRSHREPAEPRASLPSLPSEGSVFDARMRIAGSFAGVDLPTTRARVRLWVVAANATRAVLRARVEREGDASDDVELELDAHGRVVGVPRSFCTAPAIDDLVATRVLFALLGTAPAREGGGVEDVGPIRSELDEGVGRASLRHRIRGDAIEVLGDGELALTSALVGDTLYRGAVRAHLRQRLDTRDLLLRRVTLDLAGEVEATTRGQPTRSGALVLVSDWEITRGAADAPPAPTCTESVGGEPAGATACPPAEGFDMNAVVAAINGRRAAITQCYEVALRESPALAGRVRISMLIDPNGEVGEVRAVEDSLGRGVAGCIVPIIDAFTFDPPPRCGAVRYAFPFVFEPAR
jgi:hypothetical protein